MRRRRLWGIVILIISVFLAWYIHTSLKVATGYAAKYLCSHVLMAGLDEAVAKEGLSFFPMSYVSTRIDTVNRQVNASIVGVARQVAYNYKSGRLCGCTTGARPQGLTEVEPAPTLKDTLRWPLGDLIPDNAPGDSIAIKLQQIIDRHITENSAFRAITVARDTHTFLEAYGENITAETRLLGWSMSKSVVHALYGIMEGQDRIHIEDKVPMKMWQNDERKNITYGDLLHMSSGLKWSENYFMWSDVTDMLYLSEDIYRDVTDQSLSNPPGTHWKYSSGTTNILSGSLRSQLGADRSYHTFPYETLFDRIGMHSAIIETDPTGLYIMSSYIWATARDWTRFGLLYLNKGSLGVEQIFSEEWWLTAFTPTPNSDGLRLSFLAQPDRDVGKCTSRCLLREWLWRSKSSYFTISKCGDHCTEQFSG